MGTAKCHNILADRPQSNPFDSSTRTLSDLITRKRGRAQHAPSFWIFRIVLRIINLTIQLRK